MKKSEFTQASPVVVLEALKRENPGLYLELVEHARKEIVTPKSKEQAARELVEAIHGGRTNLS